MVSTVAAALAFWFVSVQGETGTGILGSDPLLRRKLGKPACNDGTCRKSCADCEPTSQECTDFCLGGGGGGDLGNECGGGVHVCDFLGAFDKCGLKGGKNNKQVNDPRLRNVVCCCHSDTCPSACCERSITEICGGNLDDAMDLDTGAILNQAMYDCMDQNIQNCNRQGSSGTGQQYVDMVAKCALLDETTEQLYCPSGGATGDPVPSDEICASTSPTFNKCRNPWCNSQISNSCFDDPDLCLCEDDPCLIDGSCTFASL